MSFPKHTGQYPLYYNCPTTCHSKHYDDTLPKKDTICTIYHSDPNAELEYDEMFVQFRSNYIDCGVLPLFSFGHGLSYGKFEYRDLQIEKETMYPGDTITVQITVANTGKMAGREVVQLYMHDHFGSTVRPVQELIDFTSVWLEPGEEKTVTFTVGEDKLVMLTADGNMT